MKACPKKNLSWKYELRPETGNLSGGDFENKCDENFFLFWKITFVRKIIVIATVIKKSSKMA